MFIFSDSKTKMDGHRQRVFTAQYHPGNPHVFITGGWDDTVQVKLECIPREHLRCDFNYWLRIDFIITYILYIGLAVI